MNYLSSSIASHMTVFSAGLCGLCYYYCYCTDEETEAQKVHLASESQNQSLSTGRVTARPSFLSPIPWDLARGVNTWISVWHLNDVAHSHTEGRGEPAPGRQYRRLVPGRALLVLTASRRTEVAGDGGGCWGWHREMGFLRPPQPCSCPLN